MNSKTCIRSRPYFKSGGNHWIRKIHNCWNNYKTSAINADQKPRFIFILSLTFKMRPNLVFGRRKPRLGRDSFVSSTHWRHGSTPPGLDPRLPRLNGVMPEHPTACLRNWWAGWNPAVGTDCDPLGVNWRGIGFEVTDQLLLFTEQPPFTARLDRALLWVWSVSGHLAILTSNSRAWSSGHMIFNKKTPPFLTGIL